MAKNAVLEYKYVIKDERNNIQWEHGGNRCLDLLSFTQSELHLKDDLRVEPDGPKPQSQRGLFGWRAFIGKTRSDG